MSVTCILRMSPRGLVALVLPGLLVAGCASSPSRRSASPAAAAAATASASQPTGHSTQPAAEGIFAKPLLTPQAAVTATGLYVAWQVSPPGNAVRSELARVDATTGQIEATRRLGAGFGQAVAAAGALWVAASTMTSETLLRLNPSTLRLTGRWRVAATRGQRLGGQVLAVAGGGLWVDGANRLLRLSLPAADVTASVALPGAASSSLSANAAGTVLVVGEADSGGRGAVQRLDPATGTALASHPALGVATPTVVGPIGSAVWISEATGMMGFVQRLGAHTLKASGSGCQEGSGAGSCIVGTNAITARLAGGRLWVTDPPGGSARNYCADPVSGRVLAPIELPQPDQDFILAIARHRIYYAAPAQRAAQYLREMPIPAGCRAH